MTTISSTQQRSIPGLLLRLEGLTVLVSAVLVYISLHGSGWLFGALLFAPDLSMIGYLRGPETGSLTYNAVHTYLLPALLAGLSLAAVQPLGFQIALIWFAHIGMDRLLGFGLKYATDFKHTHLDRL